MKASPEQEEYYVSTDPAKFDLDFIHSYLTRSYWAEGISKSIVKKSMEGSLCFGVFHGRSQVGFARMITDKATFAYLADVFIGEEYQAKGLSRLLMEAIMEHPDLQGLRRMMLATRDAHGLYTKFGFVPLGKPESFMEINVPGIYLSHQR